MIGTELFCLQSEVPRVKSRQLFYKKNLWKGLSFFIYLGHFLRIWNCRTGRKKPVLGQKKATNNFFDADHHFEPHKIGFKNFDQQSDIPKRGL